MLGPCRRQSRTCWSQCWPVVGALVVVCCRCHRVLPLERALCCSLVVASPMSSPSSSLGCLVRFARRGHRAVVWSAEWALVESSSATAAPFPDALTLLCTTAPAPLRATALRSGLRPRDGPPAHRCHRPRQPAALLWQLRAGGQRQHAARLQPLGRCCRPTAVHTTVATTSSVNDQIRAGRRSFRRIGVVVHTSKACDNCRR